MRIIQQKRRKPRDVTHRGHLCECTVFSQPCLREQNNFLFGTKPQTNISLPRLALPLPGEYTFTCTCALNRLQCLTSCCWGKASTPTECDIEGNMSHTEHQNTSIKMLRPEVTFTHTHSYFVKFPVSRPPNDIFSLLPANPDTKTRHRALRKLFFLLLETYVASEISY